MSQFVVSSGPVTPSSTAPIEIPLASPPAAPAAPGLSPRAVPFSSALSSAAATPPPALSPTNAAHVVLAPFAGTLLEPGQEGLLDQALLAGLAQGAVPLPASAGVGLEPFDSAASSPGIPTRAQLVEILDPACKGGKVLVPFAKTLLTRGRTEWVKGTAQRDLSVCCLFQQGRCKAGTSCRQVHVEKEFMAQLRAQHQLIVSCCLSCGDTASLTPQAQAVFGAIPAGTPSARITGPAAAAMPPLQLNQIGYTRGLTALIQKAANDTPPPGGPPPLEVPWSAVCRLHLRSACKYGKDCKNLHLCTRIGPHLLACASAAPPTPPRSVERQLPTPHSRRDDERSSHGSHGLPSPSHQLCPTATPFVYRGAEPVVGLPSPPAVAVAAPPGAVRLQVGAGGLSQAQLQQMMGAGVTPPPDPHGSSPRSSASHHSHHSAVMPVRIGGPPAKHRTGPLMPQYQSPGPRTASLSSTPVQTPPSNRAVSPAAAEVHPAIPLLSTLQPAVRDCSPATTSPGPTSTVGSFTFLKDAVVPLGARNANPSLPPGHRDPTLSVGSNASLQALVGTVGRTASWDAREAAVSADVLGRIPGLGYTESDGDTDTDSPGDDPAAVAQRPVPSPRTSP